MSASALPETPVLDDAPNDIITAERSRTSDGVSLETKGGNKEGHKGSQLCATHFREVSTSRHQIREPETQDMQSKQVMNERGSPPGDSSSERYHLQGKHCLSCLNAQRQQSFDPTRVEDPRGHPLHLFHISRRRSSLSLQSRENEAELRAMGMKLRQIALNFDKISCKRSRIFL
jgi:hypothetical protein